MKTKHWIVLFGSMLAFISAFSYSADVSVLSKADNSFCDTYKLLYAFTSGILAKFIAVSIAIIAVSTGIMYSSLERMIGGMAAATMLFFAPTIIGQIAKTDGICSMSAYYIKENKASATQPILKNNKKVDKDTIKGMDQWSY